MTRRKSTLWLVVGLVALAALLAGCGDDANGEEDPGYIHVEVGAEETQIAQTAIARANPTDTPGPPAPTASLTPTPYARPTDTDNTPPGDTVITRVGSTEITLGEFQMRVRFERYHLMYPVLKLTEKYGPERVLDLTNTENQYVASMFTTLADSYSFGGQIQRIMVIEEVAFQEAQQRGIEVDPHLFDANLVEYLGLQVGEGGALPPEYETRYPEFVAGIEQFAGMSEEQFRRIVRAQTLYDQLEYMIGQEADLNPAAAAVGVEMQDVVVASEEEAAGIATRLMQGERLQDIMLSLGYEQTNADTSRVLRRSDEALPEELLQAIFAADQGDVIGPVLIPQGWYVGKVGPEVIDMMSPKDIDEARDQYFLDWVEGQMDDPDMVEDFDNWIEHTPQEPLPQDISPLFRTENFTLPEGADLLEQSLFPGLEDQGDSDSSSE